MQHDSSDRHRNPQRRAEILAVALEVIAERGYHGASMREIAVRARASKETLYAWFGDKRGLFEALIAWNAERLDSIFAPPLAGASDDLTATLRAFVVELLGLLLSERAVVVNRAAISEAATDPTFGQILVAQGRDRIGPKLASYLEQQRALGRLDFEDAETAVDMLIGLAISDRQVRRLLGVLPTPDAAWIDARAGHAARAFLRIVGSQPPSFSSPSAIRTR
ncbi:MAG: TetR/AcrR family transcriptional regulator [Chloroflexi bacterium]|nr:TetR/AcrR family transcriptional regulator [Chloroflexota bacterium]